MTLLEITLEKPELILWSELSKPQLRTLPKGTTVWIDISGPEPAAYGLDAQGQFLWLMRMEMR